MTSVKCPQCGLVNWSTAANCKRCGLAVADGFEDSGMEQQQSDASPAPPPAAYTQPVHNFNFDEEELLRKLNKDSKLFYFIGGLQVGLWFFVGNLLIVDGVFNIGLSFVANKFRSRIAASFLALLTVLSVLAALVALATGALHFNLLTPLVLIARTVASVRMVYCTFKLNAYAPVEVNHVMPPPPPAFNEEESQWAQPVGSAQLQPE